MVRTLTEAPSEIYVLLGASSKRGWNRDRRTIRAYTTINRALAAAKASGIEPGAEDIVTYVIA